MFSAINSAYLPAYFMYIVLHSFVIERQDDNSKLLYFAVNSGRISYYVTFVRTGKDLARALTLSSSTLYNVYPSIGDVQIHNFFEQE